MGRYEEHFKVSLFSFLRIGVTTACFHSDGKVPDSRDCLNMKTIKGGRRSEQDLSKRQCNEDESTEDDLHDGFDRNRLEN